MPASTAQSCKRGGTWGDAGARATRGAERALSHSGGREPGCSSQLRSPAGGSRGCGGEDAGGCCWPAGRTHLRRSARGRRAGTAAAAAGAGRGRARRDSPSGRRRGAQHLPAGAGFGTGVGARTARTPHCRLCAPRALRPGWHGTAGLPERSRRLCARERGAARTEPKAGRGRDVGCWGGGVPRVLTPPQPPERCAPPWPRAHTHTHPPCAHARARAPATPPRTLPGAPPTPGRSRSHAPAPTSSSRSPAPRHATPSIVLGPAGAQVPGGGRDAGMRERPNRLLNSDWGNR